MTMSQHADSEVLSSLQKPKFVFVILSVEAAQVSFPITDMHA
jgi:hypothetical protein